MSWLTGYDYRKGVPITAGGSISGTIAVTNGSDAIVGTGTFFLQWGPGDKIQLPDDNWYTIATITDNTHLTISEVYPGGNASGESYDMLLINYQMELLVGESVGESGGSGNDADVISLLHMDGADASVVFNDEAKGGTHTWTKYGDAQIDTAQSKFGGASLLCDGAGDYISTPDSPDFAANSVFTLDFWVRRNSTGTVQRICGQASNLGGNAVFTIGFAANNTIQASFINSALSQYYIATSTGTITDSNWHHIAVVRDSSNVIKIYIDGTEDGSVDVSGVTLYNSTTPFCIGRMGDYDGQYLDGWVDEFRWSTATRWTSNFTPPTARYGPYWKIEYTNCEGHVLSTFNDLRFTNSDGETLLDYWIKSITGTTPNRLATVLIEFDSMGTSPTEFYMYYGKADAPAYSNGSDTFQFFDDFELGDLSRWTAPGALWSAQGTTKYEGDYAALGLGGTTGRNLSHTVTLTGMFVIDFFVRLSAAAGNDFYFLVSQSGTKYLIIFGGSNSAGKVQYYDGTYKEFSPVLTLGSGVWVPCQIYVDLPNHRYKVILNGVETAYVTTAISTGDFTALIPTSSPTSGRNCYLDRLLIRRYTDTEPTWGEWGEEEESSITYEDSVTFAGSGTIAQGGAVTFGSSCSMSGSGALVDSGSMQIGSEIDLPSIATSELAVSRVTEALLDLIAESGDAFSGGLVFDDSIDLEGACSLADLAQWEVSANVTLSANAQIALLSITRIGVLLGFNAAATILRKVFPEIEVRDAFEAFLYKKLQPKTISPGQEGSFSYKKFEKKETVMAPSNPGDFKYKKIS